MNYLPYSGHEGYVNDFYDILFNEQNAAMRNARP